MADHLKSMFEFCIPIFSDENDYVGCGFKWDVDKYITCKHVVENALNKPKLLINLGVGDNQYINPTRIQSSDDYDLSLLITSENDQDVLERYSYEDVLPLGTDLTLYGYTQTNPQNKSLEPRCIKSYVHRSMATPDSIHKAQGILEVNELNVPIPKGFSGGPIVTAGYKLIGMSLGTNITEKPVYKYSEEKISEESEGGGSIKETIERISVEYYGLFHSLKNIEAIFENMS